MPVSKLRVIATERRWRRWVYVPLLLLAAGTYVATGRLVAYAESPYPIAQTVPFSAIEPMMLRGATDPLPLVLAFNRGETLSEALSGVGLDGAEALEVVEELSRWADPRKIRPDDQYSVSYDSEGRVRVFELVVAKQGRAEVSRTEQGWLGAWQAFERSVEVASLEGTLEGSLEGSIAAAGGETALAVLMADVFQWDLDFTRDLRSGDTFRILYERVYLDRALESLGSILAVSYNNAGRQLEAYRFGADGAYYDADGRPIRKMFLRSPLRYSRISSKFSHRRFHPILKRYRPHYGVDYGAPRGTPVRATANGVVVSAGWDRGGGKTIKIRHPNSYLTAYLHLSGFAKGIRAGRRVSQNDVIGYVGSTGLSTAPHLDYRVQRHGRWINPLGLKSVPADPVPHRQLPEFMAWRDQLRRSLVEGKPLVLPEAETAVQVAASAGSPLRASSGSR